MGKQRFWGFRQIAALALMGVLTACGGGKSSGSEGGSQVVGVPAVTSVSPVSVAVGTPLNLVLTGTDLTRSGGIAMQFSGCVLALQAGGTDTTQTYQCTPTQVGSFSVTINSASGTVLSSVTVNVAAAGGFTKIAADGTYLPDTATTWSCVRHNATGLLWEAHVTRGMTGWSRDVHPCSWDATLTCQGYSNLGNGKPWDASSVMGTVCGKPGRLPTAEEGQALVSDPAWVCTAAQQFVAPCLATWKRWFGDDDVADASWSSTPYLPTSWVGSPTDLMKTVRFSMGDVSEWSGTYYFGGPMGYGLSVRLVAGP